MKNEERLKMDKGGKISIERKYFGLLIFLLIFIGLIGFAFAQQNQTLEDELAQLENELSSQGYEWLTDYNVSYPFIEVYEFNKTEKIAEFPEIITEGLYKIYLTNLS